MLWFSSICLPFLKIWCFRSQTLAPAQSQAASVSCHFPRHSSLNDQQLTKNMFYNHHSASVALSSNSTNCSLTPYSSSVRPASSYTPSSDSLQTEQALDPQTAAQILDSAAGFSFVGAGLNLAGGGCQAQAYSGHNGKDSQTNLRLMTNVARSWSEIRKPYVKLQTLIANFI